MFDVVGELECYRPPGRSISRGGEVVTRSHPLTGRICRKQLADRIFGKPFPKAMIVYCKKVTGSGDTRWGQKKLACVCPPGVRSTDNKAADRPPNF